MTLIYFDENISHRIAIAFNSLAKSKNKKVEVVSTKDIEQGIKDPQLIPEIAKRKGFLISEDSKMLRIKVEADLLRDYKLGVIFLKLPEGKNGNT